MLSSKSLMKSKNRSGPKWDPCGTPYLTMKLCDEIDDHCRTENFSYCINRN